MTSSARRVVWLLAAAIALAIGVRTLAVASKPVGGIEHESLVIAGDLIGGSQVGTHERMPGYGMVLAVLALTDPVLRTGLACRIDRPQTCAKSQYVSVFVLQYLAALATLLLGALIAWRLSRSWRIAALAAALTFLGTRLGDFAGFVTPIAVYHLLFVSALWALLVAWQSRSVRFAALAGGLIGAGALIEPATSVAGPVVAIVVAVFAVKGGESRFGVFGGGAVLVATVFAAGLGLAGAVALGYDQSAVWRHVGQRLAERTAYNELGFGSAVIAALAPVPLFGDLLLSLLPAAEARRHVMYQPGSLVFDGVARILPEALGRTGSTFEAALLIWRERVWGAPGAWLSGVLPVLSRGLWGGASVIALIGVVHVGRSIDYARVDRRLSDLLVVAAPCLALLAINTISGPNFAYLNPALPLLYAFAIAYVAGGL